METGKNIGFVFSNFKKFKEKLNKSLREKYGKNIKQIIKDKKIREALYKKSLGFNGNSDIFANGNTNSINDFNLDLETKKIIEDILNISDEILGRNK